MTPLTTRDGRPVDDAWHDRQNRQGRQGGRRAGRIETAVTVVSVCAIALLIAVDVVRTAPPDAPVVAVTFDVAPPGDWSTGPTAVDAPEDSPRAPGPTPPIDVVEPLRR